MKKSLFLIATACASMLSAQSTLYNKGATLFVNTDAKLFVSGTLENTSAGIVTQRGTVQVTGDFTNSANYSYLGTASKLVFSGGGASQLKTNNKNIYQLEIQKDAGGTVQLVTSNATVVKRIEFLNDQNWLLLGTKNLQLGTSAVGQLVGYGPQRFIVTNGTGLFKHAKCATCVFPIGYNSLTYNPVTIIEAGTKDTKGARCLADALANGSSGAPLNNVVAASWQITESTAGGANATVKPQWNLADELGTFDRTVSGVARWDGAAWELPAAQIGPALGADPYTRSRTGLNTFGYFSVQDTTTTLAPPAPPDVAEKPAAAPAFGLALSVFPNPATTVVNISFSGKNVAFAAIFDALGRFVVALDTTAEQQKVDVSAWPSGTYFIHLRTTDGEMFAERFVREE